MRNSPSVRVQAELARKLRLAAIDMGIPMKRLLAVGLQRVIEGRQEPRGGRNHDTHAPRDQRHRRAL